MEFSVLSNNLKMPMMGFGVFQVTDKNVCKQSVLNAIRTGYRLIDTAAVYGNEDAVGEAVREAISEGLCTRDELFITSKLWVQDMLNQDTAAAGIETSLKKWTRVLRPLFIAPGYARLFQCVACTRRCL